MKMSKRGSPYLRRAIWLASTVAAFKDPAIHALYERKRAEGKDHMTVIGHNPLTFHSRSATRFFLLSRSLI